MAGERIRESWWGHPKGHEIYRLAEAVIDTLEGLDLHFPKVDKAKRKELEAARAILEGRRAGG